MNYYHQKQQQALQAAKAKVAQDYREALALYKNPEPEPSHEELQFLLTELRILNLKQKANAIGCVADILERATQKKSSCGCSGKSPSAGYQTKSVMTSAGDRPHFFANELQRQQDEAYERFCAKFPDMCKG